MKTKHTIKQKHYLEEELVLSAAELQAAVKEFIERRVAKFQTGWSISLKSFPEISVVCSRWTGFSCQSCHSVMTSRLCKSKECQNFVCDGNDKTEECCRCLRDRE